jgi:tetratricopeptide (TPR) repeat protein
VRGSIRAMLVLVGAGLLAGAPAGCGSTRKAVKFPEPTVASRATKEQAAQTAAKAQNAADRGKIDDAIRLYEEALSYDAAFAPALNNLGVLYWKKGRREDAVRAFNQMAALSPADPRPVMNIGTIYLELGYASEALKHFKEALDRDPNDLESLRFAIRAAADLDIATEEVSGWIAKALLRERDPQYFEYFQNQRSRVDGRLEAERKRAHGSANG